MSGIDGEWGLDLGLCLHLGFDEQRIVPQVGEYRVDDRGFTVPYKILKVREFRALCFGWFVPLSVNGARLCCEFVEERWI